MIKLNIGKGGVILFLKMSGGYFITTIINNSIPFLVLPILTRYLAPEQYANVALFSFYLALSNALMGESVQNVVSKHFFNYEKNEMAKLIGNSILIISLLSVVIIFLIILCYPLVHKYINLPFFWLILIPFTSFAYIFFNLGLTILRNSKMVFLFGKNQITNTAINMIVSLILVIFFFYGWQGRLLGIILSYFISAIIMFIYLKSNGYIQFDFSKKIIKTILNTVLPLIQTSVQLIIIAQSGIFFMQLYYSKELLGVYSVGLQISSAIYLITSTFSMSWQPYIFEQLSKIEQINKIFLARMFMLLIGVVLLGVITLCFLSSFILKLMTTPAYYCAANFISWLSFGYFFQGLYFFFTPILLKFEKQKYISFVSFANMIIMVGMNVWFVSIFGYMGIAYSFCAIYFLISLAFIWKSQKVFPLPWIKSLKVLQ